MKISKFDGYKNRFWSVQTSSTVSENRLSLQFLESEFQDSEKIRLVIIEDHELTLIGIKTSLGRNQKIVVVGDAVNGKDGLRLLKQLQLDVAIIDIGLPDRDGIEVTREIKNSNPDIKVIILTLCDRQETILSAFAAGADAYCLKNIGFEKLTEVIYLTKSGQTWIDPAIARFVIEKAQRNSRLLLKSASSNIHDIDEEMLNLYPLTERELEILQLIVDGNRNTEIANKLYITVGTVKSHIHNILMKVGADDRTQAAVRAVRYGLSD
ncbi:response regulator transcription factor [Calothrix sp. UHCC 0171]|uniref:response regulator transcription factor n=1 Tax=Calothrix sp. UHCC 0171 TaxID=3110245 RepID=UPI002B20A394|nr:response regulator transcription factor [Calothrix sp. UHCC 0171]MEA5574516.1 response regulator transcription factor [Calothrix sp. UHCC 0171]